MRHRLSSNADVPEIEEGLPVNRGETKVDGKFPKDIGLPPGLEE